MPETSCQPDTSDPRLAVIHHLAQFAGVGLTKMGADRIVQNPLRIALVLIASVCAGQSLTPDEALVS